ncbi:hypothetical protein H6G76_17485 [Nostoc sp. FACHB-152]|uniref:hypothetical protein n=1 Tax=unclassified Nostoc TaxID=2593658 RepID=UPI001688DCF2|nr:MULTISPECIES: hypothetical protein [unclassified Nostoc]MBD2448915.1 hypothetical protein [Nostoc sp. FACHB-152]MBD2471169.1 hypothetical protein [Nostoc sp. FACHB-145]
MGKLFSTSGIVTLPLLGLSVVTIADCGFADICWAISAFNFLLQIKCFLRLKLSLIVLWAGRNNSGDSYLF